MIADNIAYIDEANNPVPRVQSTYRNRKDWVRRADVIIRDGGDIDHPPIANLSCFGNPIEWHRGSFDVAPKWKGEERPKGCAGCKSRPACGDVMDARTEGDDELVTLRDAWEHKTKSVSGVARYEDGSFTAFATACNARRWKSTNDAKLKSERKRQAKKTRTAKGRRDKGVKAGTAVTGAMLDAIDKERNERRDALNAAARQTGAPPSLRNLTSSSIEFTCDVWQVRTILEREYNGEVTGGDIAKTMIATGRDHGKPQASLRVRACEAITRIGRLESEPVEAPVWGAFADAESLILPRTAASDVNGVVFEIFEVE